MKLNNILTLIEGCSWPFRRKFFLQCTDDVRMSSCVLPGLGKAESVWIGKSWQGGSQSHNSKITQVSHTSGKDGLGKGGGDIRRGFPLGGCCSELGGWT